MLEEARDPSIPVLERLKFMGIVANNLDEFFMVRVAGVKQKIAGGVNDVSADGLTPVEVLADGALVLSEFAGAAQELRQAWLVNPHDINGMKTALLQAFEADDKDLTKRMKAMRKTILAHDVAAWAAEFMAMLSDVGNVHDKELNPPGS